MPSGFSWASLSGMAGTKMSPSNFTGQYPTFTESWEYFCIVQFFRFWEGLLTQIVASCLSCAVFLALLEVREGGVCFVVYVCFVFFAALIWAHKLFKKSPLAGSRSKTTGAASELSGPAELREFLACICLHLASMLFPFCLLFHYVENCRHCYTSFVNSLNKIMWNTEIAFNSVSLKCLPSHWVDCLCRGFLFSDWHKIYPESVTWLLNSFCSSAARLGLHCTNTTGCTSARPAGSAAAASPSVAWETTTGWLTSALSVKRQIPSLSILGMMVTWWHF